MTDHKKGYSSVSSDMLCASCVNGITMESAQGDTQVRCTANESASFIVEFIVSVCSHYDQRKSANDPSIDKQGIVSLMMMDGHIMRREYTAIGLRWVRCFDDEGRPLDQQIAIQMLIDEVKRDGAKRGVAVSVGSDVDD